MQSQTGLYLVIRIVSLDDSYLLSARRAALLQGLFFRQLLIHLLAPEVRYGFVTGGDQAGISLLKLFPCFEPVHNVIVRFNNIQKTG